MGAAILHNSGNTGEAQTMLQIGIEAVPSHAAMMTDFFSRETEASENPLPSPNAPESELPRLRNSRRIVLSIATEWASGHGGLSTLNRELCVALADCGFDVVCMVPTASETERSDARSSDVSLVTADGVQGISNEQAMFLKPKELPDGFTPDYIIGHSRVTGPAAAALASNSFPAAKRLHFVHMAPDEIEWFKTGRLDDAGTRAEARTQVELDLGRSAHRLVAVGPRLFGRFSTDLAGYPNVPAPLRFDPGFDIADPRERTPPPGNPWKILLLCRAEDEALKGLDIAAAALHQFLKGRSQSLSRVELVVRGAEPGTAEVVRQELSCMAPTLSIVVRDYTTSSETLTADMLSASLALMPSRAEGYGLTGHEAITAGTPVLVSRESGLGELLLESLSPESVNRIVLPVLGNTSDIVSSWAAAIQAALANREASFATAHKLRLELSEKRSWAGSVESLFSAIGVDSRDT